MFNRKSHLLIITILVWLSEAMTTMKKVVLMVDLHDNKIKQKAMKIASGLSGVESVSVDMKDKKLTLSGDVDPVNAVSKLRKCCHTEIVSVGPAKEEKKDQPEVLDLSKLYEAYPLYYHLTPPAYSQSYYVSFYEENPWWLSSAKF